jgi:membrane-associated phospholipid phosphatase
VSREYVADPIARASLRRCSGLLAVTLGLIALDYVVALGTTFGLEADDRSIFDSRTGRPWAAHWVVADTVHAVAALSFVILAAAIAVLALERHGRRQALAVLVLIVGASASAQILKTAFGALRLFGEGAEHRLESSFPSGHAATSMALGLALVWTAPAAWRGRAAVLATVYSVAIGIGLLVLGWHRPSDVVGGYLVAGAWAAATVMVLACGPVRSLHGRRRGRQQAAESRWPSLVVLGALGFAVVLALGVPIIAATHLAPHRSAPPAFLAGAAGVSMCAALVTVANLALVRDRAAGS